MTTSSLIAVFLLCVSVVSCQQLAPLINRLTNELGAECLAEHNIDLTAMGAQYETCANTAFMPVVIAAAYGQDFMDPLINALCKDTGIMHCFTSMVNTIKPCMSDLHKERLKIFMDAVGAGLQYSCEDNGQPIKDLIEKGKECVMEKKMKILACLPQNPGEFESLSLNDLNEEEMCQKEAELMKCGSEVLDECDDKTAKEFFVGIANKMIEVTPCKNYADSNTV